MGSSAALPCEAGTFGSQTGAQSSEDCTACPAGTFCFAGSTAATSCSKGTYAAAERSQFCNACPEGKYSSNEGASACSECGDGFTCPEGSVVQIPASCDPGTYLDAAVELCLGCPAGSVCLGGALQPRSCARGSYCMANASQPTECPAGSYQNETGQTSCMVCSLGSYCEAAASSPIMCPAGTYGSVAGLPGINECTDVLPGFYAQAGSIEPKSCPAWGLCPGRQADQENDVPGSIPIVVPDGQQTQTTTKVVEQVVNQTVLQLPLQVQVQDANAVNKTALRLQVAGTLGVPLHAVLLDFGASRRRLDRILTSHSRRLVALDLVVTISDEPAVNLSYVEALWNSKSSRLSWAWTS